ncbi:hypothetical protein DRN69_02085 [Candidatus Pacearchaeota archaeon]|nr:MAG: hypothetical protein DRN69_02085 [Candidatus Pacearchaeota archaeon]
MENFHVLEEKENHLFNRKEIVIVVESDVNPKREETKKLISEKFSSPSENIVIKEIKGRFGSKLFTIKAHIYSSKEDKERIEPKSKKEIQKQSSESSGEANQENKPEENQ